MPKKTFDGEGNPSEFIKTQLDKLAAEEDYYLPKRKMVEISDAEHEVLKKLLDRDRTSKQVHGGLKSLLTMTDDDINTLLGFLSRI